MQAIRNFLVVGAIGASTACSTVQPRPVAHEKVRESDISVLEAGHPPTAPDSTPAEKSPAPKVATENSNLTEANSSQIKTTESKPQSAKGELQDSVATLSGRVQELETQLASLNKKLDSTQASLNLFLSNIKAAPAAVPAHPSFSSGTSVEPVPSTHDPEGAFVHDQAIEAYREGHLLFEASQFKKAAEKFASLVEKYPDHPLAGSAQYFNGLCRSKNREYALAVQEFQKVLTSYDRSSHIADTLNELAKAEDALNQHDEAASHRQLLTAMFPQSPAAAKINVVKTGPNGLDQPPESEEQEKTSQPEHKSEVEPPPPSKPDGVMPQASPQM